MGFHDGVGVTAPAEDVPADPEPLGAMAEAAAAARAARIRQRLAARERYRELLVAAGAGRIGAEVWAELLAARQDARAAPPKPRRAGDRREVAG